VEHKSPLDLQISNQSPPYQSFGVRLDRELTRKQVEVSTRAICRSCQTEASPAAVVEAHDLEVLVRREFYCFKCAGLEARGSKVVKVALPTWERG
jgi:hypothetical protein